MWKEQFALGIDVIDEQHKKLVNYVTEARALIRDAEDGIDCYDEIEKVLLDLQDYTVEHFRDEEGLMTQYGYPGYDDHKIEHDQFVEKVQELLSSDIDFHQVEVLEEVVAFLLDWVVSHILDSDSKYVSVMQ